MKIAIATIQSNNFGNRLQNYALQEILKTYGPVASLRREKITLTRQILRQLRKCACRNAYREFDSLYITLSREILSVDCVSPDIADNYDMFVIGSDQVWNPTFSFNGPLDYLPMVPASKKIAYAASFGISDLGDKAEEIAGYLESIPSISMREEAGAKLVERLTGRKVPVVLDPSMLITASDWERISTRPKDFPAKPFLLKYVLGNDTCEQKIQGIAAEYGASVIDISRIGSSYGPTEFVWLTANCEAICTDSFHASVFALLNHKPLGIFERCDAGSDMSSRLDTLCSLFGAEKCRSKDAGFDMNCMDWASFEKRLTEMRSFSLAWLDKALLSKR